MSGHRLPKPCKAMGNLKSDTLSMIHHMILWIVIWICLISITAAPLPLKSGTNVPSQAGLANASLFLSANGLSLRGQSRLNGKASLAAVTAAAPQALKMKTTCSQHV